MISAALALSLSLSSSSLIDPTPPAQMRPLQTDRPDLTEGPYTVDAGHLQVEVDAVVVGLSADESALTAMGTNVRVGLTPSIDAHLIMPGLTLAWSDPFGDAKPVPLAANEALLRLKWNLVGGDGGDIAVALLPFVVLSAADGPSGGLIVPFNFNLPWDIGLGSQIEADILREGEAIDVRAAVSASASHAIVDDLGGYLELFAEGRSRSLASETELGLTASAGLTWLVFPDLQVDCGARVPLLSGPSFEAFVGVAFRH
ncbi:MAG: hypothetical protein Q8O67_16115 [Deltaproteobacteria bacterium]|nr:hypothetical protein [Deltaproteobacteria bacterium]